MIHPGKLAMMTEWAGRFGATIQSRGEVGFGRPCVGVVYGQSYVDLSNNDYMGDYQCVPTPDGVEDAYHKHECMAVLVHEDDYDRALEQLCLWIEWCIAEDYGIKIESRRTMNQDGFGRQLELIMGGALQARLVKLENGEVPS